MCLKILRIYYFDDKFDFKPIAGTYEALDDFERYTQFIKVDNLKDITRDSYFNYSCRNNTPDFLVYKKGRLWLHSKELPILYRKPLNMKNESFVLEMYGLLMQRTLACDHISQYHKEKPSNLERKVLAFTINDDLQNNNKHLKIVNIVDEDSIHKHITRYNFVADYHDYYLVITNRIIKIKDILRCHNFYQIAITENLDKVIELILDGHADFPNLTYIRE